jgi:hypothetical protein
MKEYKKDKELTKRLENYLEQSMEEMVDRGFMFTPDILVEDALRYVSNIDGAYLRVKFEVVRKK